jgi:hypothetical protein
MFKIADAAEGIAALPFRKTPGQTRIFYSPSIRIAVSKVTMLRE